MIVREGSSLNNVQILKWNKNKRYKKSHDKPVTILIRIDSICDILLNLWARSYELNNSIKKN